MDLITIITEIATSLRLTRPLEFMALLIVVFLISSPGFVATVLGAGTKLGIFQYVQEGDQDEKKA